MRKSIKFWILITVVFSWKFSYSQSDVNLCFISGSLEMQYDDLTYLTVLYEQKGNALLAIDTLTSETKMVLKNVKLYPDYNFAFFHNQNYLNHSENQVTFLDLNSKIVSGGTLPFQRVYSFPTTVSKNRNLFVVIGKDRSQQELTYYGINSSFSTLTMEAEDFKTSVISGYRGAPLKNPDILRVAVNLESGDIKIPKTKKIEDRPSLEISIPKEYLLGMDKFATILVKNDHFIVLELYYNDERKEFAAFDIQKQNWQKLDIKGDKTRIQSYGEWISASKVLNNEKLQAVSPGAEYRKQTPNAYGPGFDVMTKILELYYPGELILYHIPTQQKISWITFENGKPQGDSEVLLIRNETVYYRVNDVVYEAPIINYRELGESKLLIKDKRVSDIHWAFFSNNRKP